MKQFNYYFIIMALAFVGFTSCSEDEPALKAPAAPTVSVTVSPEATEYLPGTELTFTITAMASEGELFNLEITPSTSSDSDSGLDSYVYNTSETVTYTYIVPFNAANVSIEFKVTAVNPDDYSLFSSAAANKTFGVTNSWTEITGIKMYDLYNDKSQKSMVNLFEGTTYSYDESVAGDNNLKLSLDLFAQVKLAASGDPANSDDWFVSFQGTYGFHTPLLTWLPREWGEGDFNLYKHIPTKPSSFLVYNQIDYDAVNPEDLYLTASNSANAVVGDLITFVTSATSLAADPATSEPVARPNAQIMGIIKITEINTGTVGDGTDGYVVFDYKFVEY